MSPTTAPQNHIASVNPNHLQGNIYRSQLGRFQLDSVKGYSRISWLILLYLFLWYCGITTAQAKPVTASTLESMSAAFEALTRARLQ